MLFGRLESIAMPKTRLANIRRNNTNGTPWIELLTVAAIILIMIVLALPNLLRARIADLKTIPSHQTRR
jgi:competence protein ComGC